MSKYDLHDKISHGCYRGRNVLGVTICLLIGLWSVPQKETDAYPVHLAMNPRLWNSEVPEEKYTTVSLHKWHGIKLPSKFILLCLNISAVLRPYQKNLFVQRMVVNMERHTWWKIRKLSVSRMYSPKWHDYITSLLRSQEPSQKRGLTSVFLYCELPNKYTETYC